MNETPGIDILNIGAGHLKLRFEKGNDEDVAKAKKVIADMLRRGYMIFAFVDGEQKRVRQFDATKEEYILEEPENLEAEKSTEKEPAAGGEAPVRRRGRPPGKAVGMRTVRTVGIGPSAGG